MNYNFRLAAKIDLDQILEIIKDAKKLLRDSGSLQWNGPEGYPDKRDFLEDINNDYLYVIEKENTILGVIALVDGINESYNKIDGSWIDNTNNYISIHRIAVSKDSRGKGISLLLLNEALNSAKSRGFSSVRGDTHQLNIPMQKLFLKANFKHCGTIELVETKLDNKRLAYEYKL